MKLRDFLLRSKTFKKYKELQYWKNLKKACNGLPRSSAYEFYTTHFSLSKDFYTDKKILDIGCGPCGDLEWADNASERIGIDPLARKYLKLGANKHKMKYIQAFAESMPFDDEYFDVVSSFNSLDHVDDINKTISEIARVCKKEGLFLLLTEVNHVSTPCEPQTFGFDIVNSFLSYFNILEERHYENKAGGLYESILQGISYDHSDAFRRTGILLVKFKKNQ